MQKNQPVCFLILYLLLYTFYIHPEGFLAETLVKTALGSSCIKQLSNKNTVVSYNFEKNSINSCIKQNILSHSDSYIKITIADETICCAPDQKFYLSNQQQWITADRLTATDLLMDDSGHSITINAVETVQEQCTFHALSLKTNHTYCISRHNIIVHNIVIAVPLFSSVVPVIAPAIKTCLIAGAGLIGAHFAKKIKHKQKSFSHVTHTNTYNGNWHDPNDPNKDKNKNDDNHPHGIYKDAPYHHKNAGGAKSKCPDNGQHCLDYSLQAGKQRVSIEGNSFVVLRLTRTGEFHGFKVSWKDLEDALRAVLIKHGFVRKSGKIIKQITEKFVS